jgi:uncharacterized membrane protein YeaQ/YmgE (transglycosylase-associated protein family)
MGLVELLILLIIAGICGAIAEAVVGFSPGGFLVSIIVGLIGAYLGNWLAPQIGLPAVLPVSRLLPGTAFDFDIVWAILGAILLLLVISLIRSAAYRRPRRF